MKVDCLRHGDTFQIELRPADGAAFHRPIKVGAAVSLLRCESTNDVLVHLAEDHAVAVVGSSPSQHSHLQRLIASPKARLIWVSSVSSGTGHAKGLTLQVHEFIGRQFVQQMIVGVDERFVDLVRKRIAEADDIESLTAWMSETFVISSGADDRRMVMVQGSPGEDAESADSRAFRILADRWAVDVVTDSQGRLLATRLVSVRDAQTTSAKRPPMLLEGVIEFRDSTFATRFKSESSLDALVRDAGSYLAIWQQYQRLETAAITRRARSFGAVPYSSSIQLDNGSWCFSVARQFFDSGRTLEDLPLDEFEIECVKALPALLKSGGEDDILESLDEIRPDERTPFTGVGILAEGGDVILRPADVDARMEEKPPESGYLVASLRGDLVRLRRRRDAWERIRRQSCPMTHLGHLLEGQLITVPLRKRQKALSGEVKQKLGGEPTPSQILALDIALNTPDIAVIQGPPGTGKTRVLAALQSRLSELEGAERLSGSVLLSGYQHTAVENAAMSASTLGLPPIKIGRKRGTTGHADLVSAWASEQAEHVRSELAVVSETPLRQRLRKLRQLAAAYQIRLPGSNDDRSVLRNAMDLVGEAVTPRLRDSMADLMVNVRELRASHNDSEGADAQAIGIVRGLRYEPVAFKDDGPRSAHRVLSHSELINRIPENSQAILERARSWMEPEPLDFLEALTDLRNRLLEELCKPAPHLAVRRPNAQLLELLEKAEQELAQKIESSQEGLADVLWDYLESLEGDLQGVRETLERYTLVLAATCQHAVHRHTRTAKGLTGADSPIFETVIVDEAARATPLDLLIPMSLAERRIVLVGDHRQLPHLLEPDIERELSVSVNDETRSSLKDSLFQRMFELLKKLQSQDGIPRTITLDQQFRMHPVLGDFVSKTFYDEDEQFSSPRPAHEFVHGLACVPECPAIWLDVPRKKGRERGGRSKARSCEARAIANWVKRAGGERPDLSIGVIAFYGEQVREIERAAERCGIGQIEGGEFYIVPEWQFVAKPEGKQTERLRIGTVDAFQGMEFDIVVLSVTRSNDLPDETEVQKRRKYGFLMLPNRLCVAMSRQRRLLVVAGDDSMCREPNASDAIPGLVGFRALCESGAGAVIHA